VQFAIIVNDNDIICHYNVLISSGEDGTLCQIRYIAHNINQYVEKW
jgi:hypothetical protein